MPPEIYESHHIIPKSLGGSNKTDNLVKLSPREHFICHALLCKMVDDLPSKRKMTYAFFMMKLSNNNKNYSRIGNGKLYDKIRSSILVNISGKNNPNYGIRLYGKDNSFYGKKHTLETRERMSRSKVGKQTKENNPFYGKSHSEATRSIISQQQSEPVIVVFLDGTEVCFKKKGEIGKHLGICKALGIQLCTSRKKHLWVKYNIKEIRQYENR